VEVAKALGGSFKLVTLTPKTVREMTQLPKETQKNEGLLPKSVVSSVIRVEPFHRLLRKSVEQFLPNPTNRKITSNGRIARLNCCRTGVERRSNRSRIVVVTSAFSGPTNSNTTVDSALMSRGLLTPCASWLPRL